MISENLRNIKRAQKESQLLREVSNLILQIALDDSSLQGLYVSRVKLSQDKGKCLVYFTANGGKEEYDEKVSKLILYKPSIRSALAKSLDFRYTPDLHFQYDQTSTKQKRIEELFQQISSSDSQDPQDS